jgi:arabinogalactan oligomer / maltooligosaccharide transport system substrate-binding protein
MKSRRFVVISILAVFLASLMGGVAAQDGVTLVLWHALQDAEADGALALIDAFEAANPGIDIEPVFNPSGTIQDSFIAAAGAGAGPDLIIWANDSTGNWAQSNLILDITDAIDEELQGQVTDSGWGTFTFEGSIWGVPFNAKTLAFFYNKSLVLDAPETWQDVLDISEELAADGITGLGFQNGFFHSAGFLYALGGSLMDEEGNATFGPEGEGREAMEAYLQLHQDIYALSQDPASGVIIDGASPLPQFQTGEVAMVYDGIWNLSQFESDLGDDLGVVVMPALDNGAVPAMFAQTTGVYANANLADDEAKVAALVQFAKFVTSAEGQQIGLDLAGWLPVNPNVTIDDSPNLQVFADQFALGTPFPNRAELAAFWGPMGDAITAVAAGGETPADATQAAYDLIQRASTRFTLVSSYQVNSLHTNGVLRARLTLVDLAR